MTEDTNAYYKQREQQERDLAAAATDPCAKAAHLEMAECYASYTGENAHSLGKPADRAGQNAMSALAASTAKPQERSGLING